MGMTELQYPATLMTWVCAYICTHTFVYILFTMGNQGQQVQWVWNGANCFIIIVLFALSGILPLSNVCIKLLGDNQLPSSESHPCPTLFTGALEIRSLLPNRRRWFCK